MARVSTIMVTTAATERRRAGEAGDEAVAPAVTYAAVPGSTPSAVAATVGEGGELCAPVLESCVAGEGGDGGAGFGDGTGHLVAGDQGRVIAVGDC
jgi:hypothetical protein